jgi:hypothetical protein
MIHSKEVTVKTGATAKKPEYEGSKSFGSLLSGKNESRMIKSLK